MIDDMQPSAEQIQIVIQTTTRFVRNARLKNALKFEHILYLS